jgi:hypothetical protein
MYEGVGDEGGLAETATRVIAETAADQPLYLHVGFGQPHVPADPVPPYEGQFAGATIDRDAWSFNEEDVGDKPEYIRDLPRLNDDDEAWLDDLHQRRLETLLELDDTSQLSGMPSRREVVSITPTSFC